MNVCPTSLCGASAVVAGLLLVSFSIPVQGSGPILPPSLLEDGGQAISRAPEFYYQVELRRLAQSYKGKRSDYHPQSPRGDAATSRLDSEDFSKSLAERSILPSDPVLALQQHVACRAFIDDWTKRAGALPESFESEFRDYHLGALAFRKGDNEEAWLLMERLLARPAEQRRYRTVWALYLQARLSVEMHHEELVPTLCEAVRKAAGDGFIDTMDCATGSWNLEARQNEELRWELELQREADRDADDPGSSFQHWSFGKTDADLDNLAKSPVLRAVTSCFVMGMCSGGGDVDMCKRWLKAIERMQLSQSPDADRLGWVAYIAGEYDAAQRWLKLVQQPTALSLWLKAKLELRGGHKAEAFNAMRSSEALRMKERTTERPTQGNVALSSLAMAKGDVALFQMGSGKFTDALRTFLEVGLWQDAAWVAERLLTTDELKRLVDKEHVWSDERETSAMLVETGNYREDNDRLFCFCLTNWWEAISPSPDFLSYRLRWLLARRLMREGRRKESLHYYPKWLRDTAKTYQEHLTEANKVALPKAVRAMHWWEAAWLARTKGLELMGTEREPDNAVWGGEYEAAVTRDIRLNKRLIEHRFELVGKEYKDVPKVKTVELFVSKQERIRLMEMEQPLMQRWHYRLTAAAYAWRAAQLMPSGTEELADVLNCGGRWHLRMEGGEAKSQKFYDAIEARCAGTELGKKVLTAKNFVWENGPFSGPRLAHP